jgi:hypothetical protein
VNDSLNGNLSGNEDNSVNDSINDSLNDNDVDHSFQTDPVNVDNNDVAVAVGLDADASN